MDIITLTQELVRIPSESSDPVATPAAGQESGVVAFLQAMCNQAGLASEIREALPGRHNFITRLPNPGAPRLVIMSHMDTVSGRGMTAPFSGALARDRILGRGACDDKGPLAAALATVLALHREKIRPVFDLTLAATVDEECSMAGASRLAQDLDGWDLCIGLEPTALRLVHAHKGVYRFLLHTRGLAAHSSAPEHGRNAIDAMLPLLADLQDYGRELANRHDPDLGAAALSVTRIDGGGSLNIIPDHCMAGIDIRLLPDMEPDAVEQRVRAMLADRAELEEVYRGRGIRTDLGNPLVQEFLQTLATEGLDPRPTTAAFATDCSRMAHKGPCIVWGPGDIAQAHKLDEYITLTQLEAAGRVLRRFLTGN